MFESQAQWAYTKSEDDLKDKLKTMSKIAGFDDSKFEECYNNEVAQNQVLDSMKMAYEKLFVTGTPGLFINGKRYMESRDYPSFSKAVDSFLASNKSDTAKPSDKK
jgi:protein-disulfide isomerase